jgi:hypothetical protein
MVEESGDPLLSICLSISPFHPLSSGFTCSGIVAA